MRKNIDIQMDMDYTSIKPHVYSQSYDHKRNIGKNFLFENEKNHKIILNIRAEKIKWNANDTTWTLNNYEIRKLYKDIEVGDNVILKKKMKPKTKFL